MELYPEMNEKIKDILRAGGEPYLLYAAEYIDKLEKKLLTERNHQFKRIVIYIIGEIKQEMQRKKETLLFHI